MGLLFTGKRQTRPGESGRLEQTVTDSEKNKQMREGEKGGAQSGVDIGLSPSEEMLPIALVKYVCIEVEVAQEKKSDHGRHQHDY